MVGILYFDLGTDALGFQDRLVFMLYFGYKPYCYAIYIVELVCFSSSCLYLPSAFCLPLTSSSVKGHYSCKHLAIICLPVPMTADSSVHEIDVHATAETYV